MAFFSRCLLIALFLGTHLSLAGLSLKAQEAVFIWPLDPDSYEKNALDTAPNIIPDECEDSRSYVWHWDEDLTGYHLGEDWNRKETIGNDDCGSIIRSPQAGTVTFSRWAAGGFSVIIKHTLPSGQNIFTTYRHCQSATLAPEGRIEKGARVCLMGKTGTESTCHMHWELSSEPLPDQNPWIGGTSKAVERKPFELGQGMALYGSPSLLIDDWGSDSLTIPLPQGQWIEFQLPANKYVPSSLPFLQANCTTYCIENALTISQALTNNTILPIQKLEIDGTWTDWFATSTTFLVPNRQYRIRLTPSTSGDWTLIVPIPQYCQKRARARQEMVQWAHQRRCGRAGTAPQTRCVSRVETKSMGGFDYHEWQIRYLSIQVRDGEGRTKTPLLVHATHSENPLLRCIRDVSLQSGAPSLSWRQIAPGTLARIAHTTPSDRRFGAVLAT